VAALVAPSGAVGWVEARTTIRLAQPAARVRNGAPLATGRGRGGARRLEVDGHAEIVLPASRA